MTNFWLKIAHHGIKSVFCHFNDKFLAKNRSASVPWVSCKATISCSVTSCVSVREALFFFSVETDADVKSPSVFHVQNDAALSRSTARITGWLTWARTGQVVVSLGNPTDDCAVVVTLSEPTDFPRALKGDDDGLLRVSPPSAVAVPGFGGALRLPAEAVHRVR